MKNADFITNAKISAAVLTDELLDKTREFSIFDFAMFKTCLLSFGILVGTAFSSKLKKLAPVLFIITMSSYLYLIYKLFFDKE